MIRGRLHFLLHVAGVHIMRVELPTFHNQAVQISLDRPQKLPRSTGEDLAES